MSSCPEFPPFIYDTITVADYVEQVISEKQDVKEEILAIVEFIRDLAKNPFEDGEQTFLYISACCKAIRGLMRNVHYSSDVRASTN